MGEGRREGKEDVNQLEWNAVMEMWKPFGRGRDPLVMASLPGHVSSGECLQYAYTSSLAMPCYPLTTLVETQCMHSKTNRSLEQTYKKTNLRNVLSECCIAPAWKFED